MRFLFLNLILSVACFGAVKNKKKPNLAPQTLPKAGYCMTTCDPISLRVTFVDEGRENCGLDGDYLCPAIVGEFCEGGSLRKCLLMDKGYCIPRCELDGLRLSLEEHCAEGYKCIKPKCNRALRDRSFGRVPCH